MTEERFKELLKSTESQVNHLLSQLNEAKAEIERLREEVATLLPFADAAAHMQTRAERAEAAETRLNMKMEDSRLSRIEAGLERDDARAQVAALREALEEQDRKLREVWGKEEDPHAVAYGWTRELREVALASTAQAAADHDARVRAEAIEECAQVADDMNRVYWDPVGGREWRDSDKESIGRRIRALLVPPPPINCKRIGGHLGPNCCCYKGICD